MSCCELRTLEPFPAAGPLHTWFLLEHSVPDPSCGRGCSPVRPHPCPTGLTYNPQHVLSWRLIFPFERWQDPCTLTHLILEIGSRDAPPLSYVPRPPPFILRQELAKLLRLALSLRSSCLGLQSSWDHRRGLLHGQLFICFNMVMCTCWTRAVETLQGSEKMLCVLEMSLSCGAWLAGTSTAGTSRAMQNLCQQVLMGLALRTEGE